MTSAPKKPRTGEAPLEEEMPVVDGGPSVGEMPARPPPRLPAEARRQFHFFMGRPHQEALNDRNVAPPGQSLTRVLLISRRFLASFFEHHDFGPAKITVEQGEWNGSRLVVELRMFTLLTVPFVQTFDGVAAVFALYGNVAAIEIHWDVHWTRLNFALLLAWMQVASKLQTLPALTSIKLTARDFKDEYSFADMFVDSMPQKVTRLNVHGQRMATLSRKRKDPLKSVELWLADDGDEHPYLADVFRLNTPRFELDVTPAEDEPHLVHDCGPFDRNEQLQELHILSRDFAEYGTRQLLRHMRALNDHFKLVHREDCWHCFGAYPEDFEEFDAVKAEVPRFVEAMREAGFDSTNAELRVFVGDIECWREVCQEELIERLDWKREEKISWPYQKRPVLACSSVHECIPILMGFSN